MVSKKVKLREEFLKQKERYRKGTISKSDYIELKNTYESQKESIENRQLQELANAPKEKVVGNNIQEAARQTLIQRQSPQPSQQITQVTNSLGQTYKGKAVGDNFIGVRPVDKREQQLKASTRAGFYSILSQQETKSKAQVIAEQTAIRGSLGIYSPQPLSSDVKYSFTKSEPLPKQDLNKAGIGLKNIGLNLLGKSFNYKQTEVPLNNNGYPPYSPEVKNMLFSQSLKFGGGVLVGASEVIGNPKETGKSLAKLGLFPLFAKEIGKGVLDTGKEFIMQPTYTAGKFVGQGLVFEGVGALGKLGKAGYTRVASEYQFKFKPADKGIYSNEPFTLKSFNKETDLTASQLAESLKANRKIDLIEGVDFLDNTMGDVSFGATKKGLLPRYEIRLNERLSNGRVIKSKDYLGMEFKFSKDSVLTHEISHINFPEITGGVKNPIMEKRIQAITRETIGFTKTGKNIFQIGKPTGQFNLFGENIGKTPKIAASENIIYADLEGGGRFRIEKNTLRGSSNTILPSGQRTMFPQLNQEIIAFNKVSGKFSKVKITSNKEVFVYNKDIKKFTELSPDYKLITRNPRYAYNLVGAKNIYKLNVKTFDASAQIKLDDFGFKNPVRASSPIYTPKAKSSFAPSTETPKIFSSGNSVTTFRPQFDNMQVFSKSQYTYPSTSFGDSSKAIAPPIVKAKSGASYLTGLGFSQGLRVNQAPKQSQFSISGTAFKTSNLAIQKPTNQYSFNFGFKDIQLPKAAQSYRLSQRQANVQVQAQKQESSFAAIQTPTQNLGGLGLSQKVTPRTPKIPNFFNYFPKQRNNQPKAFFGKGLSLKQPKAYLPSLRASFFGLKGKKDDYFTGLEERLL